MTGAPHAQPTQLPESGLASWYAPGTTDGFGDRLVMFDNTSTPSLELLRFRRELAETPGFEGALRARIAEFRTFRHPAFPVIRALEQLDEEGGLALVSEHTAGRRLSEVFAQQPRAGLHPDVVAWLLRELTSALAALQAHAPSSFHSALTVPGGQGRITGIRSTNRPFIRPIVRAGTNSGMSRMRQSEGTFRALRSVLLIVICTVGAIHSLDRDFYPPHGHPLLYALAMSWLISFAFATLTSAIFSAYPKLFPLARRENDGKVYERARVGAFRSILRHPPRGWINPNFHLNGSGAYCERLLKDLNAAEGVHWLTFVVSTILAMWCLAMAIPCTATSCCSSGSPSTCIRSCSSAGIAAACRDC